LSIQSTKDNFEDDQETLHVPAELQSPKMIIEEQMDKVVTKMDQKDQAKNNLYSLDDGSTLLERVAPEAITTTTIAKERFIVRPLHGDIHALWMDVTHTAVDLNSTPTDEAINKANEATTHHGLSQKESIVLDISGYKTQQINTDEDSTSSSREISTETINNEPSSEQNDVEASKSTTFWGWGTSHVDEGKSGDENSENETVQLKSGQTYRIEMSLCGFSSFGYDEDENGLLFNDKQVSYDAFVHNPSILNDPRLVFRYNNHYFAAVENSALFTSLLVFKKPLDEEDYATKKVSDSRDSYSYGRGWRQWLSRSSSANPTPTVGKDELSTSESQQQETPETKVPEQEPFGDQTTFTTTTKTTSVGWNPDNTQDDEPVFTKQKNYAKTLRLTSEQLKNLGLKKGVNTISFSVKSAYQGTATCAAKVFFWDYDIEVVISDIDGTITKSDTMGHLMTMIGKDWTHPGVAQLYTDIANNGYHFLYLTSRAIGQADYTRDYLKGILQGNYQLPDGPVIMSPDRLFTSLHREVIMRKPEMFKMACLRDIQRLFGGRDPFYAGFGNRITDAISYRSVNVPSSRIFTIDPQGDVKLELVIGFRSTYVHLNDLVDQIFPPINKTIQEEYSDYNFWRAPMPEIDIPELEEEGPIPTSPKPKPIIPDPSSLPKESVVAYTPEPKRGILRGFTSRSSLNSQKKKSPPPSSKQQQQPSKQLPSSKSAPNLISEANESLVNGSIEESAEDIALSSPRSLPDDLRKPSGSEDMIARPISQPTSPRTTASIMSKVMESVFYRSTTTTTTTTMSSIKDDIEEVDDDDLFNSDLDELDLDKIPFI
jgi:phosphatidate phosphatase LPIN